MIRCGLFLALVLTAPFPGFSEGGVAVISEIVLHRQNIFDPSIPKESAWPYRATNALHFVTKESAIRRELLFKEGDPCDPEVLQESERRLRVTGLMNPVAITSTLKPDGTCRVDVATRDTWTTKPGMTFSTYGGKSKYSVELEESNFLGYGKNLLASYIKEVDRRKYLLDYRDPQFFHRTWDFHAGAWDTDEGEGWLLSLDQPFDAFTVREAYGAGMKRDRLREYAYWDGKKAFSYATNLEDLHVEYGRKVWEQGDRLLRLRAGYHRQARDFGEYETLVPGHPFGPARDYTLSLVTLWAEHLRVRYLKTRGIVGFTSDEDILLGPDIAVGLGFSARAWGGAPAFQATLGYQDAVRKPGLLWQRRVRLTLQHIDSEWRNNAWSLASNVFYTTSDRSNATLAFAFSGYHHPDVEGILYLGGEEGLRGYGYQFAAGSRLWQATLQERVLLWENVLAIANVGVAFFYDAGQVWGWGGSFSDASVYQDIGVGVRFENLHSKLARVARIDLGYAFHSDHRGWQVSVTTGDWFNF